MLSKLLTAATLASVAIADLPAVPAGAILGSNVTEGAFYTFDVKDSSEQCMKLTEASLKDALAQFTPSFPRMYDNDQHSYPDYPHVGMGALYLSYPEGTFAFSVDFEYVLPNSTATWVEDGKDFANVFDAVRQDVINTWPVNTFQWKWYNVNKIVDGVSSHAGVLNFRVSVPTFIKGCDTSCGATCNPNRCNCQTGQPL